ncbi:MAG: abscisic acid-deficient protein Aba4 family protein [Opitutaceae bacterium]
MPIWLIEYFGAEDISTVFIALAAMTVPFWIGMIFFPRASVIRQLARPFLIAPLYCSVLLLLVWKAYDASLLPDPITNASYGAARTFSDHPIAFLILFCNFQILNLFLGTMMYQKALRDGFKAPIELALCCFFGAFSLVPFSIRLLARGSSFS